MSVPYEYHVTQDLRSQTKLSSIIPIFAKDLMTIVVIMGTVIVLDELVSDSFLPVYYTISVITCILFIIPSPLNPKRRIYESILLYLKRDRTFYYPTYMKGKVNMITEKKKKISKLMEDTIPIVRYDSKYKCFEMKKGYMNIVEIITKDIVNASDSEVEYDIIKLTKFNKLEYEPYKIIAMNFPCNTREQRDYLQYKIEKNKNATYQSFLEHSLKELEWVQENKSKREFYLMYFSDSLEGIQRMDTSLKTALNVSENMLAYITQKKKEMIIHRLYNPASILTGGK